MFRTETIRNLFIGCVFLVTATAAVLSITEVTARQQLLALAQRLLNETRQEQIQSATLINRLIANEGFVQQSGFQSNPAPPNEYLEPASSDEDDLQPVTKSTKSQTKDANRTDERAHAESRAYIFNPLVSLRSAELQLQILIFDGENESGTLRSRAVGDLHRAGAMIGPESGTESSWFVIIFLTPRQFVRSLSTDQLLALAVTTCGILGAMIAGFRSSDSNAAARDFALGLSAGFIVFLAIRGGKYVFFTSSSTGYATSFNPYGAGFAGLLSGLFTEKAYDLLSLMVDQMTNRLQSALREKKAFAEKSTVGADQQASSTQDGSKVEIGNDDGKK